MDALYGLPLEDFTPRRDELAKELRAAGERDAAAWVRALRKPTAAAWLANQLARTQRADARRMLESADALRAAQEGILAGSGSASELARASVEHDDAMRSLMAKAPGLLNREGVSPSSATLERVAETLRAVALDEEAREGFAAGRLARERRASGMGFAATAPPEAPRRKTAPRQELEPDAAVRQKERERARAAVDAAKARRRAARETVADLERELRAAERDAQAAQRRVDRAAAALARGREKEARAQSELDEAQAAVKRA